MKLSQKIWGISGRVHSFAMKKANSELFDLEVNKKITIWKAPRFTIASWVVTILWWTAIVQWKCGKRLAN